MKKENIEQYFFTPSTKKLILMSIGTFGLYKFYWFYKNWRFIKNTTGDDISPFWRALFSIFFVYSCFKYIKKDSINNNLPTNLSPGFLATFYIIIALLQSFPSIRDQYWFFLDLLPLALFNKVALNVNKHVNPDFKVNDKLSFWNIVGLIFGSLILLLHLIIIFYPEMFAEHNLESA